MWMSKLVHNIFWFYYYTKYHNTEVALFFATSLYRNEKVSKVYWNIFLLPIPYFIIIKNHKKKSTYDWFWRHCTRWGWELIEIMLYFYIFYIRIIMRHNQTVKQCQYQWDETGNRRWSMFWQRKYKCFIISACGGVAKAI